ncbi:ester cyclase [Rhodococcus sp. 14-2483-1-2]|uniref:ester cyclase n=1 Tax=Rhodococcus sp. 14-2483-1-2 TaxID=2023147 RepID=UPI000B9B8358|nr:ester cyclase [Rhodococcus sp. 14-2483-1-2]OZF39573.1 hypothetical protein CH295_02345 [Rhodococcus sp. 14-2483-1-2]
MEPFVALMRRYCIDYTNRQDTTVCAEIMDPEYTLHMGGHHLVGRDSAYIPAARKQFEQFPGLGLTVNELICSGDRVAMRFTEHGASLRHCGAVASWGGIGLYKWDGARLVANFVEQDYLARRRQLAGESSPDPVAAPAVAPWDVLATPSDADAVSCVRRWVDSGGITTTAGVTVDDSAVTERISTPLDVISTEIDDIFSAGRAVGFHGVQRGRPVDTPLAVRGTEGCTAEMHVVGLVHVQDGTVIAGHVVRDRLGLSKSLAVAAGRQPAAL